MVTRFWEYCTSSMNRKAHDDSATCERPLPNGLSSGDRMLALDDDDADAERCMLTQAPLPTALARTPP